MSEQNTEIVEGLVTRPAVNGRRTYSVDAKKALVRRCLQPGVSVASIALAHGINANQLRRWMGQYSSSTPILHKSDASTRILPVVTSPAAELPLSPSSYIEIGLGSATVRVYGLVDAKMLGLVLDCLARRA
jgi:transposase-like protein